MFYRTKKLLSMWAKWASKQHLAILSASCCILWEQIYLIASLYTSLQTLKQSLSSNAFRSVKPALIEFGVNKQACAHRSYCSVIVPAQWGCLPRADTQIVTSLMLQISLEFHW